MKAYRTTWGGEEFIVAAFNAADARYKTWASAGDAGHIPTWADIRVVRAPEHDAWADVDKTGFCWRESYILR